MNTVEMHKMATLSHKLASLMSVYCLPNEKRESKKYAVAIM